jgi:CheY-like chemotaxis protein
MNQHQNNRILIVGGDSHFTYLIQRYVRRSAYKIVAANPDDDPVEIARCQQPAVIILEVDLPDTLGWSTLSALSEDPEVGQIPLIVCSWLDEQDRALAGGADRFLRMPILYADFEYTLEAVWMKEDHE